LKANPIISLHDAPERAISAKDKPAGDQVKQQYDRFLESYASNNPLYFTPCICHKQHVAITKKQILIR